MPYPWVKAAKKSAPELPVEPAIPLGNRSNGEYFHEQTPHERRIRALCMQRADELARRHGVDRRGFLASSLGMSTALWAINMAACGGGADGSGGGSSSGGAGSSGGPDDGASGSITGNGFDLGGSGLDTGLDDTAGSDTGGGTDCSDPLGGDFVFDVQTHHVDPRGAWRDTNPGYVAFFADLPQGACGPDPIGCFSVDHYIELMFLDSDTHVAVLSGVPAAACMRGMTSGCGNPLDNDQIVATRELVNAFADSKRLVNHAMITPNVDLAAQLDAMQGLVEELGVAGWKCYPPWGPTGAGWWLDDPAIGIPFIEQGRSLGVRTFCIHKGLPLPGFDAVHTDPRDVAVVAAMFPDCNFIVYHSAWLHGGFGNGEGPYDPAGAIDPQNPVLYPADMGVNSLISALEAEGLGRGSNVYAELGSVWTNLMQYPDQAAHVIGKLLYHLGEDNVLWGTDSIWTGSPQGLIEAFRRFQISEAFQETYGYPALDRAIKRKIFGLNAAGLFGVDPDAVVCEIAGDGLQMRRRMLDAELGPRRWTQRSPVGPRTRREMLRFRRLTTGPG